LRFATFPITRRKSLARSHRVARPRRRVHRSPVAKRTSAKATIQHLDRPPFRGHGSG
jgi:hypothetical protein